MMTPRIPSAVVVPAVLFAALAGCHPGGARGASSDLEPVRAAWRAGDTEQVYRSAKAIQTDLSYPEPVRQEAAYFAGKAAAKLKRPGEAAALMNEASNHPDLKLRGDALAERGLALCELEQFDAGARHLLKASEILEGEAKGQAYYHAAIAEQKMGYWPQARTHLIDAMRFTADPAQQAQIRQQLAYTGYTLQLGPFPGEAAARQAAEKWSAAVTKEGLPAPLIQQSTDAAGRPAWVVRAGQFTTWDSANGRRKSMGADQAVIVPLAK